MVQDVVKEILQFSELAPSGDVPNSARLFDEHPNHNNGTSPLQPLSLNDDSPRGLRRRRAQGYDYLKALSMLICQRTCPMGRYKTAQPSWSVPLANGMLKGNMLGLQQAP